MKDLTFDPENCPIARVSKVIQGKWTMVIIFLLSEGTLRFHEIILNEKNPALSEIGKTAFDEDGFIKRNYELSFRYSKRKEHNQYWHLVDKNDYYCHSFIDLKRVEIR